MDANQSVGNGATTAPTGSSGGASTTPVQSSTPTSAATKNTVQGGQVKSDGQSTKAYDEKWWKEHQEGVFAHPRFKELTSELSGVKDKYSKAEPVMQFAEQIGGLEPIQELFQYFGPVYHSLTNLAQTDPNKAQAVWAKLVPYLSAVVSGQDIAAIGGSLGQDTAAMPEFPEDQGNPEIQMMRSELEQLKRRDAMRSEHEVQQQRQSNFNQYLGMYDSKVKELGIPKEMSDLVHNFIASNIGKYMPRDPRSGQQVNALDVFSEQAFQQCWDREVEPRYKAITGSFLDKTKANNDQGSPAIPDTSIHGRPAANMAGGIRSAAERRAAMMNAFRGGGPGSR